MITYKIPKQTDGDDMKTITVLAFLVLIAAPAFAGSAPQPLDDHSVTPAPMEGHTLAGAGFDNDTSAKAAGFDNDTSSEAEGFGNDTTVSDADLDQATDEMQDGLPDGYFTRSMKTLQGTLVSIDTEAMTAKVRDGNSEIEFGYDRYTVFMRDFRPVEPGSFKGGARVVGLFDDSGGDLYLGRLIEISKYKSRRRRRRRR